MIKKLLSKYIDRVQSKLNNISSRSYMHFLYPHIWSYTVNQLRCWQFLHQIVLYCILLRSYKLPVCLWVVPGPVCQTLQTNPKLVGQLCYLLLSWQPSLFACISAWNADLGALIVNLKKKVEMITKWLRDSRLLSVQEDIPPLKLLELLRRKLAWTLPQINLTTLIKH